MAAFGYGSNTTTDGTGSVFLVDYTNTASGGFAIPESYRHWEGWYYNGKRYNSSKEALIAKNKDLSIVKLLEIRDNEYNTTHYSSKRLIMSTMLPIRIKHRNSLSRRQIAVQKRKMRLHNEK